MKRLYRKPRTKSRRMCSCGNVGCYAMWNTPASTKMNARTKAGLCMACGNQKCTCKRSESTPIPKNVIKKFVGKRRKFKIL